MSDQGAIIQSSGGKAGDAVQDFDRRFFESLSDQDLDPGEKASLTGAVQRLYELARLRVSGHAAIEVSEKSIAIVNDDMPFLVDSVTSYLRRQGLDLDRVIHPIMPVTRDAAGKLLEIGTGNPESMMLIVLHRAPSADIVPGLKTILSEVRAARQDSAAMLSAIAGAEAELAQLPAGLDVSESAAFLGWLREDHFILLGSRTYRLNKDAAPSLETGSGLGVLRSDEVDVLDHMRGLPQGGGPLVSVSKTQLISNVHRHVPMDVIAVRAGSGRICLFVGLFTGRAYGRAARDIPLLRRKVLEVAHRAGFPADTHNGKLLVQILDTYPRDELFQMTEDDLFTAATQLMALEKRPRFGLFLRKGPFGHLVSVMIYVPRQKFDFTLRRRLEVATREAIPGARQILLSDTSISGGDQLTRLHLVLTADPALLDSLDPHALEQRLSSEVSDWSEKLAAHLAGQEGQEEQQGRRYAQAFPFTYRQVTTPLEALADVQAIEALLARSGDSPILRIAENVVADGTLPQAVLTLYRHGGPIPLSDLLPVLERFGFRVLTEAAYPVLPQGCEPVALQRLEVELPEGATVLDHDAKLTEAFDAVWLGEVESDQFNRLTMSQGLSVWQVIIIRAYAKYLRQTQFRFTQEAMEAAFNDYPQFASLMVAMFETVHDPKRTEDAESRAEALEERILAGLDKVANADDDAILRAFLTLIRATLRTNYYHDTAQTLSLKIDSQAIQSLLPPPVPLVEIFVYSARVEAVHLRGGRIARGGIRWSDRREDFRTEILGLMKAQMVKNAVIVPMGSKGGFVCKRLPAEGGRSALQAEAIACYRLMMQGLLDLTDNYGSAGTIVPPANVVRLDGDDPYLVVAADKGTASFSDIANGVSQEYGFWLDDAFASGGSSGYDHKRMGITARGAWEAVRRHFRELGRDVQSEPTTVAGVGDMSGDVFGNALLLSSALKLVAAFDHRHIFLDPTPDPATSHAERRRLFDLPASSWDDYNRGVLSPGALIVPRSVKIVELTPEIRAALDIEEERLSPAELIRAILRAPVDLLFFGGIGTYIKSPDETHAEVGDRANDSHRIDGGQIRASVIAEGANLACTQRGRIAYAMKGGRINTDFIDNSAGVDTSDHEVNIKILLKPLLDAGRLTRTDRDRLLAEMTDEVGHLVLSNNYQQNQVLSRLEARSAISFDADSRYIHALEKRGLLNRTVENLPDDEALAVRGASGVGLTRPELAVILAYGKMTAYERLIHSSLTPTGFDDELEAYFPKPLQQAYPREIAGHALKREIVMTRLVNEVVNRAGPTFLYDMENRTGADLDHIVEAFLRVTDAFGLRAIWSEVESLDGRVPAAEQTRMMLIAESVLSRVVPRLLRPGMESDTDSSLDREAVEAMAVAVNQAQASEGTTNLSRRLALFSRLTPALDLVPLARLTGATLPVLARLHVEVSQRFGLGWLAYTASITPYATDWERRAADALIEETYDRAAELVSRIALSNPAKGAMERFVTAHAREVGRLEAVLTEAMGGLSVTLPLMTLVASEVRRLVLAARG